MNRLGVRGKWFMAMGLIFSLVVWWTAGSGAGSSRARSGS